jgi:hypothetical protein
MTDAKLMSNGMKEVRPRDLLAFSLHRANAAKLKLAKRRGKDDEKACQLAYRDCVVDLHMRVADYFGDPIFEYEKEPGK